MEYQILGGNSAALLEEKVNDVVNFGWKPIGGVSLTVDNYQNKVWIQAMIKGD